MITHFIKNLYAKCKMHGTGDAQVVLSDDELYALIVIALHDLGWIGSVIHTRPIVLPSNNYYGGVKYRRILSTQPMPTMDQIGPRVLLEFGSCESRLLANWMTWRKWIYDIDNRAAQETGYVFEPIIASCLGGKSVGARISPVKRVDDSGRQTANGRQIDCYVPSSNIAYELKLRVTIAASGQGRFGEELSFPSECQVAGISPVLLVLDPTPSNRLDELSRRFLACGGEFYQGKEAWDYMKEKSGEVVSVFIEKYIRPVISEIEDIQLTTLEQVTLTWEEQEIVISGSGSTYQIKR